jgi:hypothetical protein
MPTKSKRKIPLAAEVPWRKRFHWRVRVHWLKGQKRGRNRAGSVTGSGHKTPATATGLTWWPADPVNDLPGGEGWLYKPKYDGFRCLAFRSRDEIHLQSENQKSLHHFFPNRRSPQRLSGLPLTENSSFRAASRPAELSLGDSLLALRVNWHRRRSRRGG